MQISRLITLKNLNARGIAHIIAPLVVVVGIAAIGSYVLAASHADTVTSVSTATATTGKHLAILGTDQVVAGTQVAQSTVPFSFIGSQNVNFLGSGESLSYSNGTKGDVTACYEFYITQPKAGTATATVQFANNNNYFTKTLSSTDTSDLQQVCVSPGTKTNPGYAIKNLTSSQVGTTIQVYRTVLSWQ